jgi:alkanesulfonate monooxygenase SsuD/methylene tetrahydromethanopterin reductase-like flavin-dependent oxidoreductase (luciferase family)
MSMKVSPKQEDEQDIAVNYDERGLTDQERNVDVESEVNEGIVGSPDDIVELINDSDMEKGRVTRVYAPPDELDDVENLVDEKV